MADPELQLHGPALLRHGDQVMLLRGRAALLVALVALEPGVSRERAARLLWPDAPRPRHNLRQQLLRFRQSVGQSLIEGDEQLQLAARVGVALAAPGLELLADEYITDDRAGEWLLRQRQAQRRAALAAGHQAVADAERDGNLDTALRAAQALVALAPQDESAAAALMRVHYLRGDAVAGLAAYRDLQQGWQAPAGAVPAAPTLALAQALQRARAVAPVVTVTALPVTLRRPPRCVGRQAEWAALQQARAQGQAVLVEGEAGQGKSRLLADWLAQQEGALFVAGRPGDPGVPYATLARLLRPLALAQRPALSAAGRQALALLVPIEAANEPAVRLPTPRLRPDALQAAVAELLAQVGVQTVCLDDLHFADDATLDLVCALALSTAPVQWLMAQRPAETGVAASRLVDALAEAGRLLPLRLQPLVEADVNQLLDDLGLDGLGVNTTQLPALARALCRHSGGNPLFLLETVKQGLIDGRLVAGGFVGEGLPRPEGVGVLIERRLQRLSTPALTLARVAAITGIDFCIELAEAAIGQAAVHLAGAWQELQDAQVLRDDAFAHDLVADAVLRGVPQVVARRVHAQCAHWLEGRAGEPARIARHWQLAGEPAAAAAAFGQAADRALRASRRNEEADLQAQAAQCWGEAGQRARRFDALVLRAGALVAARLDEQALRDVQALEGEATDDEQRLRAIRVVIDLLGQRGHFQQAVEAGTRGLALAKASGHHAEQARLASEVAGSLSRLGRCDEALDLLRPLQDWVDVHADDDLCHLWHGYRAAVLGQLGRLREALDGYDVCVAAAERLGRRDALGAAVLNQGVVWRTLGRLDQAHACSQRGLQLKADDPEETSERTLARLMHARDQAESGCYAAALQAFDDVAPRLQAMGGGFWTVAAHTAQAQMWLHLGQLARAQQTLAGDDSSTPVWMQAARRLLRLEVADWLQQAAPTGLVAQALELAAADPARLVSSQVRALRASAPAQVLTQAPALAERARAQERLGVVLALHTHEARAALRLGNTARAAAAARGALGLQAEGFSPEFMYGPEVDLVAWQALSASGLAAEASAALQRGAGWVRQRLPQVPAAFLDSFLHRNPVNRELLAAAARQV